MKKTIFSMAVLALITACTTLITAWTNKTEETPQAVENEETENVVEEIPIVEAPDSQQDNSSLSGIITIAPTHHANVTLLMGGTVKTISVNPGQYVAKGQIVATLSNPEFVELQQTYLESLAQTEYLQNNYMRQDGLATKGATSQKTQQQSKAEYLSMKSRLDATATRLKQLGIEPSAIVSKGIFSDLAIVAPISGYVADIAVNMGKYLSIGDRICDIIDQGGLQLQLNAFEKDLETISVGDNLTFTTNALQGQEFDATVKYIDPIVDDSSHSVKVYANVSSSENSKLFRTGMFVRARKK